MLRNSLVQHHSRFHRSLHMLKLLSNSFARQALMRGYEKSLQLMPGNPQHVSHGKLSGLLHWCCERIAPCRATVQLIAQLFFYLHEEPRFLNKGAALHHVFPMQAQIWLLTEWSVGCSAAFKGIIFLERSSHLNGILLWFHSGLTCPSHEPLKLFSAKHLTWWTFFHLALALSKKIKWVTASRIESNTQKVRSLVPFLLYQYLCLNLSGSDFRFEEFTIHLFLILWMGICPVSAGKEVSDKD